MALRHFRMTTKCISGRLPVEERTAHLKKQRKITTVGRTYYSRTLGLNATERVVIGRISKLPKDRRKHAHIRTAISLRRFCRLMRKGREEKTDISNMLARGFHVLIFHQAWVTSIGFPKLAKPKQ